MSHIFKTLSYIVRQQEVVKLKYRINIDFLKLIEIFLNLKIDMSSFNFKNTIIKIVSYLKNIIN